MCAGLSLTRGLDRRQFFVQIFFTPELVKITDADLANSSVAFRTEPEGVYALTFFDSHNHQPRANQTLSIFLDPWRGKYSGDLQQLRLLSTGKVRTDHSGTVVFLGQPTSYHLHVDTETGMTIVPL
jgi:hypothetical protein